MSKLFGYQLFLFSLVAVCIVPLRAQQSLPVATGFEVGEGYVDGSVDGQGGFSVDSGSAVVTDEQAYAGSKSVKLEASDPATQVSLSLQAPVSGSVVFSDFALLAKGTDMPLEVFDLEGGLGGFVRVGGDGRLYVVNGTGSGSGEWVATNKTFSADANGLLNDWVQVSVRQDFSGKRWDLYVDGELTLPNLKLWDDAATYLQAFAIIGYTDSPLYVDGVSVSESNPLFLDVDQDGMDDAWESIHGLDTAVNDRDLDLDLDGLSNVQEYWLALDPNVANSFGTGDAERAVWDSAYGNDIALFTGLPTYPLSPDSTGLLTSLDAPEDVADAYGARVNGLLSVPVSGEYRFWVSGNNRAEFWLAPDAQPYGAERMAFLTTHTGARSFDEQAEQVSDVVWLDAGQSYYFELLHKEAGSADHLSLAWEMPGGERQVVLGNYISAFTVENDNDSDGLDDAVEQTLFSGAGQHGLDDYDNDGIANAVELYHGLDPLVPNSTGSGMVYLEMYAGVAGASVADLQANQNFPASPSSSMLYTGGLKLPENVDDNYGQRVRALVTPAVSGDYTFYVASNNSSEVYLSTDSDPANSVLVASVSDYTQSQEFSNSGTQRSEPLSLEAGQSYYIEILHKEGSASDHLTVAWQLPGDKVRVIGANFLSPVGIANDADYDGLDDSWELQYSGGDLNVFNALEDTDGDGLSNLLEAANNTNPLEDNTPDSSGLVLREIWFDAWGSNLSDLYAETHYPDYPDMREYLTKLETPNEFADGYGEVVRGYIEAPFDGDYTFSVAGSHDVELFLSTSEDVASATLIAGFNGITERDEWNKYTGQTSAAITLQQGQRYYFEVHHKESWGDDFFQVAWQIPGDMQRHIIKEDFLSPLAITTGEVKVEKWTLGEGTLEALDAHEAYPSNPESVEYILGVDNITNIDHAFGARVSGYVIAPETGDYIFGITVDAQGRLSLSSDESEANLVELVSLDTYALEEDWNKYPEQQSPAVSLIAGQRYYFEAEFTNRGGGHHLQIGWKTPSATEMVSIPTQYIASPVIVDADGDGMDDVWEATMGLSASVAYDAYLDSDGDGLNNQAEYRLNSDALVGDSDGDTYSDKEESLVGSDLNDILDMPERDLTPWSLGEVGSVDAMVLSKGESFFMESNGEGFVGGSDEASYLYQSIIGDFTLIGKVDDINAIMDNASVGLMVRDSLQADQKTYAILVGQEGWVKSRVRFNAGVDSEVLDSSSLLWNRASGSVWLKLKRTGNVLVSEYSLDGVVWNASGTSALDLNSSVTVGVALSAYANGLHAKAVVSGLSLMVDSDGDGIDNVTEVSLGTDIFNADTDGDGISDYEEVYVVYSDPLVQDFDGTVNTLLSIEGSAYTSSTGQWLKEGSKVFARDMRGSVEYAMNVPSAGSYRLDITGGQHNPYSQHGIFDLLLYVDGSLIGSRTLIAAYPESAVASFYLPYLDAGSHDIAVEWVNGEQGTSLEIQSLDLVALGGSDNNGNGIVDWLDNRLAATSTLDETFLQSQTSPYTLEGESIYFGFVEVDADYDPTPEDELNITLQKGIANGYFAHVDLSPEAVTNVTVSEHGGALTYAKEIEWVETNMLATETMTIRAGDSLLLSAHGEGLLDADVVSITVNDSQGNEVAQYSMTCAETMQQLFENTDAYTVTTVVTPATGDPIIDTTIVQTISVDFGIAPRVVVGETRDWIIPGVPAEATLAIDSTHQMNELPETNGSRTFSLFTAQNTEATILARLGENGSILGRTIVYPLVDYWRTEEQWLVVDTFDDGTELWSATFNLGGEVPDDIQIKIRFFKAGVTFLDGTTEKIFTKEDLNELGILRYYMLRAPESLGSTCHHTTVYQGGVQISTSY